MESTRNQRRIIHAILAKKGLLEDKEALIGTFTEGRTETSTELSEEEAALLIDMLNKNYVPSLEDLRKDKMARKIIAMSREINWVTRKNVVTAKGIEVKSDYTALDNWMTKYSYLKKVLREYTYEELPKLVTQFENGPYKAYISKNS